MLIWIVLVCELISLLSGYLQYELLQTAARGETISMAAASANDTRERVIGIVHTIVFIISAITFIQWFRRAYFNLHQKQPYLSHAEEWAAGAWFVPIVNLYRPYQIMKELYRETRELLEEKGISTGAALTNNFLGLWWTLWIINGLVGQFIFRYSLKAGSISELTTLTIAGMTADIMGIPLAFITVKVIMDYSRAEPLLGEIRHEEDPVMSPVA